MRKVLLRTTASGTNNAVSFVNQTARKLHIRRTVLQAGANAAVTVGDIAIASLDEVPVAQAQVNDSRSHIDLVNFSADSIAGPPQRSVLSWQRDDLVLQPDEAIFLNTIDLSGAPPVNWTCQIMYQD